MLKNLLSTVKGKVNIKEDERRILVIVIEQDNLMIGKKILEMIDEMIGKLRQFQMIGKNDRQNDRTR